MCQHTLSAMTTSSRLASIVAMAILVFVPCVAYASPLMLDALRPLLLALSVEADYITGTEPSDQKRSYDYNATYTSGGWTGRLLGVNLDLTDTGNTVSYAMSGTVNWTTLGTIGGAGYSANSSILVQPAVGGEQWILNTVATLGATSREFSMSGLFQETPDGIGIPYTDTGGFTIDGELLATVYSLITYAGTKTLFDDENGTINTYQNWDEPGNGTFTSTLVVPEPAALALVGIGFAGIGFARRRRVN